MFSIKQREKKKNRLGFIEREREHKGLCGSALRPTSTVVNP